MQLFNYEREEIYRAFLLFNEVASCRNSYTLVSGKTHMLYPPSSWILINLSFYWNLIQFFLDELKFDLGKWLAWSLNFLFIENPGKPRRIGKTRSFHPNWLKLNWRSNRLNINVRIGLKTEIWIIIWVLHVRILACKPDKIKGKV